MRRAINESVGLFARCFEPQDPIIELGAMFPPGAAAMNDLRSYFRGRDYIGCDIRRGNGVDRLEDAQSLTFGDESVGTVLLFEILEHLPRPDLAVAEAHRVLSAQGLLAVSVPFQYRLHGFPSDYWRFTASGIHSLLEAFEDSVVFAAGPRVKPAFIFAVAAKRATPEFTRRKVLFEAAVVDHFRRRRLRGHLSVLRERTRDLVGALVGRAHVETRFFSAGGGGYIRDLELDQAPRSERGAVS